VLMPGGNGWNGRGAARRPNPLVGRWPPAQSTWRGPREGGRPAFSRTTSPVLRDRGRPDRGGAPTRRTGCSRAAAPRPAPHAPAVEAWPGDWPSLVPDPGSRPSTW
jgi:hypothetical protein